MLFRSKSRIVFALFKISTTNIGYWFAYAIFKNLNGDYIDVNKDDWLDKVENESYSNTFEKYPLPCFLILDSMGSNGTIYPDTERLIQALRHWLTNQSDLNKN